MKTPHHRKMLEQKLKSLVKNDPHGLIFHGITHLGLAELTRESHFPHLARLLMRTVISKTPEAVCYELLQACMTHRGTQLTLEMGPEVYTTLHETFRDELAHLKTLFANLTVTKISTLGNQFQLVNR
jgi:Ribonuclease G/E